jgi:hypothetical protein
MAPRVSNPVGTNRYTSKKAKRLDKIREVLLAALDDFQTHYQRTNSYRQLTNFEMAAVRYLLAIERVPIYLHATPRAKDVALEKALEDRVMAEIGIPKELLDNDNKEEQQ